MSWKKYFVSTPSQPITVPPQFQQSSEKGGVGVSSKFMSYLPEVYAGHPQRIQRYYQYADMDNDSDIAAALDTIADFCTQSEEQSDQPFSIKYNGKETETEIEILKSSLAKWTKLNDFRARLWDMFRDTIKNGDAFFLRDPETNEWLWIDHYMVELVKVDETAGKEPDEYIIRGLDLNKQAKFGSNQADPSKYRNPMGVSNVSSGRMNPGSGGGATVFSLAGSGMDARQRQLSQSQHDCLYVVDAKDVVHLSLSVGMDVNWPFGESVLKPVFKTFKQKEMLEDSIIIYRVQRAPERRIFYIDTGSMPPVRAKAHIEQIKNEIHQRRLPGRNGNGSSALDAAYNPLSILDDFFFATSADGRGSKVETLPGGDAGNDILDLTFFAKKLGRGLRIPSTYLSMGDDQTSGGGTFNDGKMGTALIQEYRFNKYCMRLQSRLAPVFDREFKHYVRDSGLDIDSDKYELRFVEPQNFTKYRQTEIDQAQMQVYSQISENKKLAERFKLKRFLNLTDEEILENERLWAEENASKVKKKTGSTDSDDSTHGLSAVGVGNPGGDFGDMGDMGDFGMPPEDGSIPPDGGDAQPGPSGEAPPTSGAPLSSPPVG